MDLLIHGVFDAQTLKTLLKLNVPRIGFDLRARSLNLIPFHILKTLLPLCDHKKIYLTFEDDKSTTIHSFLDLLGEFKDKVQLEFRDNQSHAFYHSFNHPYTWFFNPQGEWQHILMDPQLKTLVLPLKWKERYQNLPELWRIVGERGLDVVVHVDHLTDLEDYIHEKNLSLSADLGRAEETGFRKIDHERLLKMKMWRKSDESFIGQ